LDRNRMKDPIRLRPKMKLSASNVVVRRANGIIYRKIVNHQRSIVITERNTKHDKVGWKSRNWMEEECDVELGVLTETSIIVEVGVALDDDDDDETGVAPSSK